MMTFTHKHIYTHVQTHTILIFITTLWSEADRIIFIPILQIRKLSPRQVG